MNYDAKSWNDITIVPLGNNDTVGWIEEEKIALYGQGPKKPSTP